MHAAWFEAGGGAPFAHYGLAVWDGPGECTPSDNVPSVIGDEASTDTPAPPAVQFALAAVMNC